MIDVCGGSRQVSSKSLILPGNDGGNDADAALLVLAVMARRSGAVTPLM